MSRERAGRKAGVMIVIGSATVLTAGLTGSDAGTAESSEPQEQTVTVTEGTNAAVAAAPDGSVIMELQGLLFRVPAGGGDAEALTDPELQPSRPDVGDDGRIAFQSYADGRFHVSTMAADGSDVEQVTEGEFDDREPRWSPDGSQIAFSSDRGGSYDIWTVDVSSGELQQWTDDPGTEVEPSWHPDGTRIAYSTAGATDASTGTIESTTADGQVTTLVPEPDGEATLHAPSWAPDGDEVAYVRVSGTQADLMVGDEAVTSGQDVFVFTPVWSAQRELMYTADGAIRELDIDSAESRDVPFSANISLPDIDYDHKDHDFDSRAREQVTGVLTPALSPDATQVAFVALNDLWVMPVDGEPERITDDEFHVVDPVWSRDGKQLAYSSDRAGTEDIYVRDMSTGDEQRVTAMDGAEVSASFSPDGTELAFQDQDGATYVLTLDTGDVRELVPALFGPGRPSWSPDGSTIAFAAVKRYSERFREGTSQILTVDVDSGEQTFHAPGGEHDSISTRGDDGPVWSPDGTTMAFVVNSTLQVMPVDESGAPTGPARQINDDVADAPTWSGDSSQLLYMSNGELRLADASTGEAETVDVDLSYRPDRPTGSTTIHAGAFWDGTSRELQHDVDIVVAGNRIRSVSLHDDEHREGEVVDASDLTVMPGLWDSHVHQEYASRFFGDRQGRLSLSYGITSTVSVGDQVYRAMEDREALEAGERVGPNFYATGEPIDGSRVYYNFMRPTTSDEQVELELSRARALDYDFLKTYVRLPADRMRTVIDAAHDMGVPSGSHYLSPGAHLGQDGTTHLAATQRLGFARTSTATGSTYSDVPTLYGAGRGR